MIEVWEKCVCPYKCGALMHSKCNQANWISRAWPLWDFNCISVLLSDTQPYKWFWFRSATFKQYWKNLNKSVILGKWRKVIHNIFCNVQYYYFLGFWVNILVLIVNISWIWTQSIKPWIMSPGWWKLSTMQNDVKK